jgi:hypothetical protein
MVSAAPFPAPCAARRAVGAVAVALDDADELPGGLVGWRRGLLFKEGVDGCGVAAFVPVEEDAATGNVGGPEVAELGFSDTGFEIADGGFVDLAVGTSPVFVLDGAVDDGEPVGG